MEMMMDQEMMEKFGKRKMLRRMSKQFLGNGLQENPLGKKIVDIASNNKNKF